MNIEQAITALESSQADPVPAIEYLLAKQPESASALLRRFNCFHPVRRDSNRFERLHNFISTRLKAERVAIRRMVVALGAMQSPRSVPFLLNLLSRPGLDRKLREAAGWSLANIGEASVMPLFIFSRCREILESARSLAIVSLGYIADPRVPSILHHLWREYRLEVPNLVIATLIALTVREGIQEARRLAFATEQSWHFHSPTEDYLENYWVNLQFESSISVLWRTLEHVQPSTALPAWPRILQKLESH